LATTNTEWYNDLHDEINTDKAINFLAADVKPRTVGTPIVNIHDLLRMDELDEEPSNKWNVTAGVSNCKGSMYVPRDDRLCNEVISLLHNTQESGHSGALKTTLLVSQDFQRPTMDATIYKFIARCELCHRINATWHAHEGTNMPLPQL